MYQEQLQQLFDTVTNIFPNYRATLSDEAAQLLATYKPQNSTAHDYLRFTLPHGSTLSLYIPETDLREAEQIKRMVNSLIEITEDRERLLNRSNMPQDHVTFLLTRLFNSAGSESLAYVALTGLSIGYDLTIPRAVCILDINALEADDSLRDTILRSILYAIRTFPKTSVQDLVAQITNYRIVLCKRFENGPELRSRISEYFSELCTYLMERFHVSVNVGVGNMTQGIADFGSSFVQAQSALKYAHIFSRNTVINFYEDYTFEMEFSRISPKLLEHFFEHYCVQLDALPQLVETVEALIEHNMDVNAAAQALYIHRNTAVFRLNQIKKRFGLNPLHDDSDRFTLISIYIYYKLSRRKN